MPYPDLDFNLTDEQKAKRHLWREFGSQVMRPVEQELGKLTNPAGVIVEGSVL